MAILKEGSKAPAFSLVDDSGQKVQLKDFKGKKVILYFYPKDLTPGCTQEACDFQKNLKSFQKKKATILGVSRDSMERHQKFKEKMDLTFSLLADEDAEACKAYGVWKKKSLYGREFMGIERTTVVIDEAGKIQKIYPKVKVKGHVEQILEDL